MLLLAGAGSALALPPLYWWPLLFPGLGLLFQAGMTAPKAKHAFWAGWIWGYGYFLAGLYWIAYALLTDAERFGWLIPLALTFIPGLLALFIAVLILLFSLVQKKYHLHGWRAVGAFALCVSWSEVLRGMLFTGFPWNLLGYAHNGSVELLQMASWVGAYGLSIIVLLVVLLPLVSWQRRTPWPALLALIVLTGCYGYGHMRLQSADRQLQDQQKLRVRLVQPNIAQHHKWDPELRFQSVQRHVELSRSQPLDAIDVVVWSETAVPFFIDEHFPMLAEIAKAAPPEGLVMTGALRAERMEGREKLYNSVFAFDGTGQVIAYYDKRHLVPFGEYIPFRHILPLDKITHGAQDFSEGSSPAVLTLGELPATRPLICYEAIFPYEVQKKDKQVTRIPPRWLLNVTNDAWFGISSGPYQHFEAARTRALETGLPLVRAANTGISAVIDRFGRVDAVIPLGVSGIADTVIHVGDGTKPTEAHLIKFNYLAITFLIYLAIAVAGLKNRKHHQDLS